MPEALLAGHEGYQVHLDGYNQLSFLTGETDSNRKEIVYYEGPDLQAVRYGDWKAHFTVQTHGWAGPKDELNAPLLFNLRRDPYEKTADESGMYTRWMGNKMWAFGPAKKWQGFEECGLRMDRRRHLVLVGGLFVMEALSVIFQVGFFKMTHGKRIFRMAPLHHHFELKGWPEPKVIVRFWIIAIALAAVNIFGGFLVTQRMLAMYKKKK